MCLALSQTRVHERPLTHFNGRGRAGGGADGWATVGRSGRENHPRLRWLDGAHEDRRRQRTFRCHYYRSSHAAYERTRLGASTASAQVRGQDYRPLGASNPGEHTGLRGIAGGYDVRETLRLRRVATRDEAPYERALRAGHRAPDRACLSSSTVAPRSSRCSLIPGFPLATDHCSPIASKLMSIW